MEPPKLNPYQGWAQPNASGSLEFTVPEQDKEYIAEPLVLPLIEMKEIKAPVVLLPGADAPEFVFSDFENNERKLSELRGKYVLIDFWATWCGPCIAEIPMIQAVFDEFKNDERLVVLSLSIDKKLERAKKFAEKKGMPWQQGWLANEWKNLAIESYGITGIPSVWLIGPDGKIVAKGLRGEKMKEAVRKALGE